MKISLPTTVFLTLFAFAEVADSQALDLTQIYGLAKSKIETVQLQKIQTDLAKETLKQYDARFYPKVAFLLDYTRIQEPTIASSQGVSNVFYDPNQYDGRFALTFTGLQGYREYWARKSAVFAIESQDALLQNVERTLFIEVAKAYYGVLSARADVANLDRLYEASKSREKQVSAFVRLGKSKTSDLLQQRTQATLADASRIQAKSALRAAENFLSDVAGLEGEVQIADDAQVIPALAPLNQYLSAVEARGDIRSLKKQIEASSALVSVAHADYYPSIDLKGNIHAFRSGVLSTSYWDFGFSLNVPLFEGFRTNSLVRSSELLVRQNQLTLMEASRNAQKEIHAAYDAAELAFSQIAPLKNGYQQAMAYYERIRKEYEQHLVTNLDVNLALNQVYSVKRSYDQSVIQFKAAYQTLIATSGSLP